MENPMARVASLPPYQLGMSLGVLIGFRSALDIVVAEGARQDDAALDARLDPLKQHARTHEHASSVLLAVAKLLASRFRQA